MITVEVVMSLCLLAALFLSVGEPRRVEIVVAEAETGKPLEKATVRVFNGIRPTPYVLTDAAGKATVEYPPGGDLTLDVHTPAHIQQRVTFLGMKPRPATLSLKLRKGTRTVGGIVVDEDGKPVAGATVRFSAYLGAPKKSPGITELVCDIDAVTNAEGRWTLKVLDQSPIKLHADPKHPDFAYARSDAYPPGSHEFIARTAKQVLKRGIMVRGVVRDDQGKPIAGASVVGVGDPGRADDRSTLVYTSKDGGFQMQLMPGRNTLTVQAVGRSPDYRQIWLADKPADLAFTLPPGRTVRGRVVDADRQALIGVKLAAAFDGLSTMSGLRLTAISDESGSFTIHDAPAGSFVLHAFRDGFTPGDVVMASGRNETSIVIKPIGENRAGLVKALDRMANEQRADRARSIGGGLDGVVTQPDGRPAAGALILLATKKKSGGWFRNGAFVNEHFSATQCCDDGGRFTLPLQGEPYALAVSHDSGWAMWLPASDRNLHEPPEVKLTPWATIEGTFFLDGKPAPMVELRYSMNRAFDRDDQRTASHFEATTQTDAAGRFVMTRVPAKPGRLSRHIPLKHNGQTSARICAVDPKPGEKLEFPAARQRGRTVVGRLKLPPELEPKESEHQIGFVCLPMDALATSDRPWTPIPKELEGKPRNAQMDWIRNWSSTPEGRSYYLAYQRLRFEVEPDGRFRIDGANADALLLEVTLRAPTLDRHERGDVLAVATKRFVVPPMPEGYEDEPLDLGEVEVVTSKATRQGQKLADFAAKTLEGKPWKLSSDAGKVRILDFWATWCGPCHEALPEIAALHEELAGEGLVIVGLSVDDDPADAAELVRAKKCDWSQVHIGPKSPILEKLGVEEYPTFIVVDRDGKVCYRGPYASSAGEAARQALSR
jgi:thiol-disulfide isomerase/thioredoxin